MPNVYLCIKYLPDQLEFVFIVGDEIKSLEKLLVSINGAGTGEDGWHFIGWEMVVPSNVGNSCTCPTQKLRYCEEKNI